jgi:hypothetical protein
MAAALAAICIFALVGLVVSHSHGKSPHRPTAQTASGAGSHAGLPASPPPTAAAEIPATKATMLVRATATCWLQVARHDGKVLFSQNIYAGQSKLFTAKNGLSFIIGNAPAVDVVINGHDVGSPASQGNVAKGTVAPGADTIQQA